ncbi:uncharacterized protein LOC142169519 [Nicotiana tabacum]|uniref:Uncharacterized protein LOC142169519 n=1 Tax=Nicotiana tabacum TaxID=4097 RepID=A0AC58SR85_TOBAC
MNQLQKTSNKWLEKGIYHPTYSAKGGYKGSPFSWWNGRSNAECIFKRSDRSFVNFPFQNMLPTIEVEHLIRTGLDHASLLMTCGVQTTTFVKPFRFLNFWTNHATFIDVVRHNWEADFIGDPFLMFKQNIKRVKAALSKWIRETFGDIFKQLAILEDIVRVKEMLFEEDPTTENRIVLQKAQSESKKYLSIKEQYWKKKAGMTWFAEGYRNTSFFHNHVNGKRKKLQLKRIKSGSGNLELSRLPTIEEVRATVFELSGESASGSDGFTGLFYQTCWDVIGTDIHNMVKGKPANVVIKLDMAKAYDRVSWKYLLHVLRKMGFFEHFINMVWNLMSNNWYSVLVNGQSSGFFKSTRGVKQRDPISPALFILSAEVLSRSLNKLFEDKSFVGFGMPKWSDPLNHLAYVDDTIIFAFAHPPSLSKIMAVLGTMRRYQAVGAITGFARGKFPFTYLGCPIFYTRRRKDYYEDLMKKVKAKLHSWKGKLLSFGGKATLISSVLQSMPVHMLSVLDPPSSILGHLHKTFVRFFWSTKEEGRSRHWASWQNLCLPKEEGGLGFRSLNDVSKELFAKLWWRFRTTKSLWSNFMWNKYCKKELPIVVHFRGGSHVWRQMLNAREEVEHEIEVAELRQGEAWDDQLLDQNEEIAEHIRLNVHYEGSEGYWDRPYWMPTPSGKLSVSSTWQILRHRADPNQEFKLMWIKDMIQYFKGYKPILITTRVTWKLSFHGWYKCNTDGASKGNPGPSSLGFCVRDDEGDVLYARAVDLGVTTNVVAEAKAILQGLEYCVEHYLHPLILETDSLVMNKAIEGE